MIAKDQPWSPVKLWRPQESRVTLPSNGKAFDILIDIQAIWILLPAVINPPQISDDID